MNTRKILALTALGALTLVACKKEEAPVQIAATALSPEKGEAPAAAPAGELPPGHPGLEAPAGEQPALPPGHPPTGALAAGMAGAPTAVSNDDLSGFVPPTEWQVRPTRPMLAKVFAAPKVEGDSEDAEVTLSFLSANIPLEANIQRWCGQFELEGNKGCLEATSQTPIQGTANPTTVIEMAGAFKAGSMGGAASAPKPGFKLVVVSIAAPGKTWFLKLTGPAKTVAKWKEPLVNAAKAAK